MDFPLRRLMVALAISLLGVSTEVVDNKFYKNVRHFETDCGNSLAVDFMIEETTKINGHKQQFYFNVTANDRSSNVFSVLFSGGETITVCSFKSGDYIGMDDHCLQDELDGVQGIRCCVDNIIYTTGFLYNLEVVFNRGFHDTRIVTTFITPTQQDYTIGGVTVNDTNYRFNDFDLVTVDPTIKECLDIRPFKALFQSLTANNCFGPSGHKVFDLVGKGTNIGVCRTWECSAVIDCYNNPCPAYHNYTGTLYAFGAGKVFPGLDCHQPGP